MRKREIIKALRTSRGEPSKYVMNFLMNLARAAILMHKCLSSFEKDALQEAKRNYIISMSSCLETFYRDLAIHVLNENTELLEIIIANMKIKKSLQDIYHMFEDKISFQEYVVSHFNFQNIVEIDKWMSYLLSPDKYISHLDNFEAILFVGGKVNAPGKIRMKDFSKDWKRDFARLFEYRHDYVHDANLDCRITNDEMSMIEGTVLTVAQITAYLFSSKYKSKFFTTEKGYPLFLTTDDLISEGWELVK